MLIKWVCVCIFWFLIRHKDNMQVGSSLFAGTKKFKTKQDSKNIASVDIKMIYLGWLSGAYKELNDGKYWGNSAAKDGHYEHTSHVV